jgi:hypothetical protein
LNPAVAICLEIRIFGNVAPQEKSPASSTLSTRNLDFVFMRLLEQMHSKRKTD